VKHSHFYAAVAVAMVAVFLGCNPVVEVTDNAGVVTLVKNASLSGVNSLTVLCGGSVKNIPLESISEIAISSEDSRTVGGKLFFLATISMQDASRLDARDKNNNAITFVAVTDAIAGNAHNGGFSIGLADIAKVKVLKQKT
jgi:hypothetical protein